MRIAEKVAVVTGGGSGIGRSLCRELAARGCHGLVVADIDVDSAAEVASGIREEHPSVEVIAARCDVRLEPAVDELLELTVRHFGRLDIAFSNAGVLRSGAAWETTSEEWSAVLGVNLWGVIHGVRSFVPYFIERGEGHLVNTASIAGFTSAGGLAAYNASKHAVVAISETLQRDLLINGVPDVKVSVLCPGFVATSIAADPGTRRGTTRVGRGISRTLSEWIPAATDPSEVAVGAVDGVERDDFYILTHPAELLPQLHHRIDDLERGRTPGPALLPPTPEVP